MVLFQRARHVVLPAVFVVMLASCGTNSDDQADLPPAALEGRSVVRSKQCSSCHGRDGEGSVGPAFVGLFGSEVQLQDGPSVIADRDYLVESIVDPSAKRVESYNLRMPETNLSVDEIDSVIAYIEALAVVES